MVLPLIPILAIAALVGGASTLSWYYMLDPNERERADRIANEVAFDLFGRTLDGLSESQAKQVMAAVEKRIGDN
jgi:hypothetical protein